MRRMMIFVLVTTLLSLGTLETSWSASSGDITAALLGDWQGTLHAPIGDLPAVLHLVAGGGGTVNVASKHFTAPLKYIADGNQVTITVPAINGTCIAILNGDLNQMNGTWRQNGGSMPFILTKVQ
jgi:hypothetical protein